MDLSKYFNLKDIVTTCMAVVLGLFVMDKLRSDNDLRRDLIRTNAEQIETNVTLRMQGERQQSEIESLSLHVQFLQAKSQPISCGEHCKPVYGVSDNAHKGHAEIIAEAKSIYAEYRAAGHSRKESRRLTHEALKSRYAGDGRILAIIYWVMRFALLFLLL